MNFQKIILIGNATVDAQVKKSKKGDVTYTSFSLAVNDSQDKVNYFPVVAFGKLGESAAKQIAKGRQVLVEGRVEIGEKGYFNVIPDRLRYGLPTRISKPATKPNPKK